MVDCVSLAARAKLNLSLRVLGRRADGFHALESVVAPVELHDDIEVRLAPGPGSQPAVAPSGAVPAGAVPAIDVVTFPDGVDCSTLCPPERNLCAVAARAFLSRLAQDAPLRGARQISIRVVKRIPIGGGLGGGSADAAAVLSALQTLAGEWHLEEASLLAAAAETGSDVPALLAGGPVLMEGRGERVRRIGLAHFPLPHVVLANPGVEMSAASAYAAWDAAPAAGRRAGAAATFTLDEPGAPRAFANDLEPPVAARHPEVAALAAALRAAGARVAMVSGSGATVFALAASEAEARRLAESLPSGVWRRMTRLAL